MKYKLYTYDLWGNDDDGYEVNDVYPQSGEYEVTATMSADEIKSLIDFTTPDNIEIDDCDIDNGETIYFSTVDMRKPVCELRAIEG